MDVVLMSGDIANGPMDWNLSEEEVRKYQSDLERIVESFMQVKNCVYYIPGNVSDAIQCVQDVCVCPIKPALMLLTKAAESYQHLALHAGRLSNASTDLVCTLLLSIKQYACSVYTK